MKPLSSEKFNQFIIDNGIIGLWDQPVKLKSGKESFYYVNWRKATNDAFLLEQLTNFIVDFFVEQGIDCDTLYGVPEGASKTAVIAGLKLAKSDSRFSAGSHVVSMGRAKPKEHGDPADRFFIGKPKGKTWVLEDTVTTGGSLLNVLESLKSNQVEVSGIVVLTDRGDRDSEGLSARDKVDRLFPDLKYVAMSSASDLLPLVFAARSDLNLKIRSVIEAEIRKNFD